MFHEPYCHSGDARPHVPFTRDDRRCMDLPITRARVLAFLAANREKGFTPEALLANFVRVPASRHARRMQDVVLRLHRQSQISAFYEGGDRLFQHKRPALAS